MLKTRRQTAANSTSYLDAARRRLVDEDGVRPLSEPSRTLLAGARDRRQGRLGSALRARAGHAAAGQRAAGGTLHRPVEDNRRRARERRRPRLAHIRSSWKPRPVEPWADHHDPCSRSRLRKLLVFIRRAEREGESPSRLRVHVRSAAAATTPETIGHHKPGSGTASPSRAHARAPGHARPETTARTAANRAVRATHAHIPTLQALLRAIPSCPLPAPTRACGCERFFLWWCSGSSLHSVRWQVASTPGRPASSHHPI